MSRFGHLRNKTRPSLDEFIEGANNEPTIKKAKKRISKANILLSITGRSSMDSYGKPLLMYLKKDIKEDMEKYCLGSNQSIINYLLRRGLNALIEKGEFVLENQE